MSHRSFPRQRLPSKTHGPNGRSRRGGGGRTADAQDGADGVRRGGGIGGTRASGRIGPGHRGQPRHSGVEVGFSTVRDGADRSASASGHGAGGCIRKFWGWRAIDRSCFQRDLPGAHEDLRGGPDCANLERVPFARRPTGTATRPLYGLRGDWPSPRREV